MPPPPMHPRKSLSSRCAALVLWLAAVGTAAAAAAPDPLEAALARMDLAAANFKGLSADVAKVAHNALLNDDDRFNGTIAVRRPRARELTFVLDILPPDPKKVRLTGHKLEMYYPKKNELQIVDLDKKGSKVVDQFMLLGFGSTSAELRSAYRLEFGGPETVAGQKSVRLVLTPKAPEVLAKLPKFELWLSDSMGIAVQQKLWEPGGDYEMATYTNIRLGAGPGELKWDVPKDAKKDVLNK
jgi:outer membrane lipoprotein-sorting protein